MSGKPIALIVDDDNRWLSTFEETLGSDYQIKKARTLSDVTKIIDNKELKFEIALVDIRLNNNENDDSGLSAMFSLNKIGIPCIATTAYGNGDAIRAALMIGRAKDVWFKDERLVVLKEKVENIGNRLKEEQKNAVEMIDFTTKFAGLARNLLTTAMAILTLIAGVAYLLPNNFLFVIAAACGLIVIIYSMLALFYNKITGEQFIQLIKIARRDDE